MEESQRIDVRRPAASEFSSKLMTLQNFMLYLAVARLNTRQTQGNGENHLVNIER